MINKGILMTLLFIFSIVLAANAQDVKRITGKIVDNNKKPLIGASVIVLNDVDRVVNGVITNLDGEFSLVVANQYDKLMFSFIGFKTQKVTIGTKREFNITLYEDSYQMDEVVITGKRVVTSGLFPVAADDLGTTYQKVELADLETIQATSIEDLLTGRLTNVDMVASSGDPGSGVKISIRGTSSISANTNPLIILDGMPYHTNSADFNFATADADDYGALLDIAPENLESIEVLKDAGATAIYGSEGANGVLIINTKRGKKGPTRFTYVYKGSVKKEMAPIPFLTGDEYIGFLNDALWNTYLNREGGNHSMLEILGDFPEVTGDPNYVFADEYDQDTDWVSLVNQLGFSNNHNLSLSGGGEKAVYRLGINYLDEEGTSIGTGYNRFNAKVNMDFHLSRDLMFVLDIDYTRGVKDAPLGVIPAGSDTPMDPRAYSYTQMPNMSPYLIDDNGNVTDVYFTPEINIQGGRPNPVALAHESKNQIDSDRINAVFKIDYNIVPWLRYDINVQFAKEVKTGESFLPQVASGALWTDSDYNVGTKFTSESFGITTINKLLFRPTLPEKHTFFTTARLQTQSMDAATYEVKVSNIGSINATDVISGGIIRDMKNSTSRNTSVNGNLQAYYCFNSKYILSGGLNLSGTSRFGKNQRWGYYPNVSAQWKIGEENLLKDAEWLDMFNLRFSYGQTGNSPSSNYSQFGNYVSTGSYNGVNATKPGRITLDNLKWETTREYNFGLNFLLFKSKLEVTFDYYDKLVTDLLRADVNMPTTTAFEKTAWVNYGDMSNIGWEITAFYEIARTKDFSASISFNFAQNTNKILSVPDNITLQLDPDLANGKYETPTVLNNPTGSVYGYLCDGVYETDDDAIAKTEDGNNLYDPHGEIVYMRADPKSTGGEGYEFKGGDARYRDMNFDGVIDKNDIVYLGNSSPDFLGGFGPNLQYKNLTMSMFFHYRIGHDVRNIARMNSENMYGFDNQSTSVLRRWRKPGDVTDIPRALHKDGYNYLGSSRFVEKGSYLRLKNISLAYDLPKHWLQNIYVRNVKIYSTISDPFTWTNYSGLDPDNEEDKAGTPRPTYVTFGINVNF